MKSVRPFPAALPLLLFASGFPACAQDLAVDLKKIYRDETHCLVGPEIRSAADKPISCYCRDELADANYVYRTYLITEKDRNLNGAYLRLSQTAEEQCAKKFEYVYHATMEDWRWNGPEVTRIYPPDRVIEHIKPKKSGFRPMQYLIVLTYRDAQGHVTKTESYSAIEDLPPFYKPGYCPPGAVCPK
jgi:hypothetical protein